MRRGDPRPAISIQEEAWHSAAMCRGASGDWVTMPNSKTDRRKAKSWELAHCDVCPVQAECLDFALEMGETFGIFGGMLPEERRAMVDRRTAVR